MRAELPHAVRRFLDDAPRDGAHLVYDAATLARTLADTAAAARAADLTALAAVKAFPLPPALALAATHLGGFDIASADELSAIAPHLRADHVVSIADPSRRALAAPPLPVRTLASCESPAALAELLGVPHLELAARVSASITGKDPAIGAVQSGHGHYRSRFGLDAAPEHLEHARAELRAMAELAHRRGRPLGLHLHASDVAARSPACALATARAALDLAAGCDLAPAFLNLGGGWHGVADLTATWTAVRRALPAALPLFVEPGRALARDCGFAVGRVCAARALADRELRVVTLSRACHLRWSQLELVARAPRPDLGRKVLFAGPTCSEDDVLGEWLVDRADAYAPGDLVVFRNVTGYAAAWNTGFGGTAAASVHVLR